MPQKADSPKAAPFGKDVAEGPDKLRAYWTHAEDGLRLRVAHWPARRSEKGTIFVFTGRTENLEKYGRTASSLTERGYALYGIDWRGQGLSDRLTNDRRKGHITSFQDYQLDAKAMIQMARPLDLPKPWYLLGHSMGGSIGLRTLAQGAPFAACAFTGPMWGINLPPVQRVAAWSLSYAAKLCRQQHRYVPGKNGASYVLTTPFEENRLTHNPDMYLYYQRIAKELPDQIIGGPTMGWLLEALKETKLLSQSPCPNVPSVTFCGTEEQVVEIAAAEARMRQWERGRFDLIEGAAHDILCETDSIRQHVFDEIDQLFSSF